MPISEHKNFAISTLATPPSSTDGTSLVVASGHGALFPEAPFNVTVWPTSVQPTSSNAEIMRVTNKATDVFTVTRAQEGSSARTFAANDQIAATATARVFTDVEYGAHGWFNVKDPAYGAMGDGVTDDTAAIQAALTAASAAGGGRIVFPRGTYLCVGYSGRSLSVPLNDTDYGTTTETVNAHFHLVEPENLWIDAHEATLSTAQTGYNFFVLDGPRNVRIDIGRILTPTAGQVANSTLDVSGLNAIAITSTTRDGWNVEIPQLFADHCNVAVYVFGDAAASYRVRGIRIGTIRHDWGIYGVALHNNGDDVTIDSLVTTYVGRPLFAYGVDGIRGNIHNTQRLGGLHALLKAYDRDLTNVNISYRVIATNTSVPSIEFASEHNVAAQPTPCSLRNIVLHYDDTGSTTSGVGLRFRYLVDGSDVGTVSTCIFDNFRISGRMDGTDQPTMSVQQTTVGLLNIDGLLRDGVQVGREMFSAGGFFTLTNGVRNDPVVGRGLNWLPRTTVDTTQYGEVFDHQASSAATTLVVGKYVRAGTAAAAYTNTLLHTIRVANPAKGSGSTITKAVGVFIEDMDAGTTNIAIEAVDPISAGGFVATAAAATQAAGVLSIGNTTQSTVGAAGGASALPATPTGYIKIYIGSTQYVIPYYAQA